MEQESINSQEEQESENVIEQEKANVATYTPLAELKQASRVLCKSGHAISVHPNGTDSSR